ncbi:hypothetical protein ASPZODRAFT_148582 [Penicilliopsis zonata CBS 506.65]|uniref:SH3 domain-containing protein n=1 Tax=Penicilliopsis zonata CBS 506.65 TaxID=1073090 RepID=A0A1L9SVN8_9EURO|nr:hypothetical protein ASPZODRAFT_148582 [Penicilliopsis zonata CBS 506.65]OJJ51272.1 hypothetical protein ASPZODRAFT_148582 [Penicilliopsis zonata CBS 506.65]
MANTAPPRSVRPGDFLVVVHDFEARGTDELTLRRGDKVQLVELDEGFGDGWYLGKDIKTGATGLFPGVYTAVTPKIPVRQQIQPLVSSSPESREEDEEEQAAESLTDRDAPVMSPISEDGTPHASRHVSASDMQLPATTANPAAATPSPKQPQRSSSSPLPAKSLAADIQQTIRQSIDSQMNGEDSPVMNETLSVIDEHITNLSTPRHSIATQDLKPVNDSASEYSSHISHRLSYINGHETEEEEENQPTEETVRNWSQAETAKQLRSWGIEPKHCDIFEEQEITGDVLLDMDQDFIFMKEFDFGVMGRRLKTWHRIKAFQEEIKGLKTPPPRGSIAGLPGAAAFPSDERAASRAGHTGPLFPRIPSLSEKSPSSYHQHRTSSISIQHPRLVSSTMTSSSSNNNTAASSPMTPQTPSYGRDSLRRPSAASIREINHSRRHSSIDATGRSPLLTDTPSTTHRKKPSFDRNWTMSAGAQGLPPRPGTSSGATADGMLPQHIFRGAAETNGAAADSAVTAGDRYDELDRGYFSGTEVDSRRSRRLLQKRTSTNGSLGHSQKPSYTDDQGRANLRHSRIGSAESIRDQVKPISAAATIYHKDAPPKGRFRSLSTRLVERSSGQQPSQSSTFTNPEEKSSGGLSFLASLAPLVGKTDPEMPARSNTTAPLQVNKGAGPRFRRTIGLRNISDVIGKGTPTNSDSAATPASPSKDQDPSSSRAGSTTPSGTSFRSSERLSTDGSNKATTTDSSVTALPRPRTSVKGGVKSKKDTSAYTRGLEKKTPQEQIEGCDYYGWMKKRSSNLMTTWKPRLFVLRGRRLSYYYSENDTEERGLIDITAHRVLRADNDPIIQLHATLTGATSSPTSPPNASSPDATSSSPTAASTSSKTKALGAESPFFFKLVPPKSGSSRTVQFTKPAIHYFQVDNVQQGRLWMAALMKATIERDLTLPVETTNKQKTISLKQARLMNQRPPALMTTLGQEPPAAAAAASSSSTKSPLQDEDHHGLMIQGLNLDKSSPAEDDFISSPVFGSLDTGPISLLPDSPAELLVLADPQLEGDSSLPSAEDELLPRLGARWTTVRESIETQDDKEKKRDVFRQGTSIFSTISNELRLFVTEDLPRSLGATRKRIDLWGNDHYLAHIYRTLHWWTQPTHVTVLGDLIGSQWVTDEEFDRRSGRYWNRVFRGGVRVSDEITSHAGVDVDHTGWSNRIINVAGNHDIGYSGDVSQARLDRFERAFGRADWDVRFSYEIENNDTDTDADPDTRSTTTLTPTIHLINLNSLTLDSPPFSEDIQGQGYAYLNDVISHRSYPVEDRTTFTLLLTHLPLHKADGICTDGPLFTFHDHDDEDGPDGIPRFKADGLKEQNHLSDHVSFVGVLQGIFGMSGDEQVPGHGRGRNGLILTGHDHTGCDVVHYVNRTGNNPDGDADSDQPSWSWAAKRFGPSASSHQDMPNTPSIREVTLRSMMGEFGGNAGLLSVWFDTDPAVREWRYEIVMCPVGVQHIWWAVHIGAVLTLGVMAAWAVSFLHNNLDWLST